MKSIFIFLSIVILFVQLKNSYYDVGHIDAIFFNFKNLTMANMMPLVCDVGSCMPKRILDPSVEYFYYNIGKGVSDCPIGATIACIKFHDDNKSYALSSSINWAISETGNNVSFDSNTTISFVPFNSIYPIGPKKIIGSIKFIFECTNLSMNSTLIVNPNTYDYTLIIKDHRACQQNLSKLIKYLSSFSYVLGAIAICIGVFLNFFGLKIFRVTLFIIGAIIGFMAASMIFTQFLGAEEAFEAWQFIVIGIGCLICATVLGFVFAIIYKVGIVALCAFFGITIWLVIYDSCLTSQPTYILYTGCIISAAVFGILSILFLRHIVIISTSFIGSYLFIRGISVYAGGFPNVFLIYDMIKSGAHFDNVFYIYLGAIILLTLAGVIVQEKTNSEKYKKSLWNPNDGRDPNYVGLNDR